MKRRPLGLPVEEDVRRELRFHLEMRTRELQAEGLGPEEARQRALRSFGNYDRIARQCRQASTLPPHRSLSQMLESLAQDFRFALRSMRRAPGFVALAVATLGLGLGANTAIFSVVNAVLLQPLPYPEPERIVRLAEALEDGRAVYVAPRNFLDWQSGADSFTAMAIYSSYAFSAPSTVLGGEVPARAWVLGVSEGFFGALGVGPVRGRAFDDTEWNVAAPAAIVSHRFWRTFLGAPIDLQGVEIQVSGSAAPVVGVMPEGFQFPAETDVWYPANVAGMSTSRTSHGYEVIARLREGVEIEAARDELAALHDGILASDAEDAQHPGVAVDPLHEVLYGDAHRPLLLLLGAAGLVLLVACSNLASALLARGASRRRELAIRSSLGAYRSRIVRQLFTESLLLGLLGSIAGVAAGSLAIKTLVELSPESIPRAGALGLDGAVLAFALALALATTLLFGLLPAWRLARQGVAEGLRGGTRGNAGDERSGIWSWLIGAEVALAVLLLVGSGLLVRSFREVLDNDPGFDPRGVLTVDLSLPANLYPTYPDVGAVLQRVIDELEAIPGVSTAGAVNNLPLTGSSLNGSFRIEGRPDEEGGYGDYRAATANYFSSMGIPLVRGRMFTPADDADAPHVALINQAAAERFWPGEDPIGQHLSGLANDAFVYDQPLRIVGIVGNVRHHGLTREANPEVYVNGHQRPMRLRGAMMTVRTQGSATDLVPVVRDRIAAIDDRLPLIFATMEARIGGSVTDRRFVMTVIGIFSLIGLVLAAVGIYGVVSYSTAQRTREIGIRMALGAAPGSVRRLVVRGSLLTVGLGLAAGMAGALIASRLLDSLLFGVSRHDPFTFVTVVAVLAGTAWIASAVPAWRGSRVDPMITMRGD